MGVSFGKYLKNGRPFRLHEFELLEYCELKGDYLTNVFPQTKVGWKSADVVDEWTGELLFTIYRD